jgi:hypothetical protein
MMCYDKKIIMIMILIARGSDNRNKDGGIY